MDQWSNEQNKYKLSSVLFQLCHRFPHSVIYAKMCFIKAKRNKFKLMLGKAIEMIIMS